MGILVGLIILVIIAKLGVITVNTVIMASLTPEQKEKQKAYDSYIKGDN